MYLNWKYLARGVKQIVKQLKLDVFEKQQLFEKSAICKFQIWNKVKNLSKNFFLPSKYLQKINLGGVKSQGFYNILG